MKDTPRFWLTFALLFALSIAGAIWLNKGTDARLFAPLISLFDRVEHFLAEVFLEDAPTLTGPDVVHGQQASDIRDSASPHSLHTHTALADDHTANDHQVCGRPPTKGRTDTGTVLVYKWEDENGRTHMADKPPPNRIANVTDISGNKRDFTYQILTTAVELPINFQGQIHAGSKRMYDTWHFFLGEKNLRQSRITLKIIDQRQFDAVRAREWPNSKPVAGFYMPSRNEAFVRYDSSRPDRALATSFHEISHLITASHLGPTAPWLTEGLAEYFETMDVSSQSGTIKPNTQHLRRLSSSSVPSLGDFLRQDRLQWNGPQRDLNYATAWSLMHFLMQGAPGMYAIKEVIEGAHAHSCKPFSAVSALDKAYPGGLLKLEGDWRKWLAANEATEHQT